ncbi:hypothetical protein L7F22_065475 [Adiantum nelumboides]|nr:hypothetical protein [Adiantum nelumboides]
MAQMMEVQTRTPKMLKKQLDLEKRKTSKLSQDATHLEEQVIAKDRQVHMQAQNLKEMEEKMLKAQQAMEEMEEHNINLLSMKVASSHKVLQTKEQQLERTKRHKELIEQVLVSHFQDLDDDDDDDDEAEAEDNEDQQETSRHDGPDDDDNQDDPPSGTCPSLGGATNEPSNPHGPHLEPPPPGSQGDKQDDRGAIGTVEESQKQLADRVIIPTEGSVGVLTYRKRHKETWLPIPKVLDRVLEITLNIEKKRINSWTSQLTTDKISSQGLQRNKPKRLKKLVWIGCGAGYAGDRPFAALKLLMRVPEMHYLVLECLAERTLAIRQEALMAGGKGYDPRISEWMHTLLPEAVKRNVCIITNMGAVDAEGAQVEVLKIAKELQMHISVSTIREVLTDSIGSKPGASTYLGAAPVVKLLEESKPNVILTTRLADASLFHGL